MTKQQFLYELKRELKGLPEHEIDALIEDYEAHFSFGAQNGKTEEHIAKELGSPEHIAREAFAEMNVQRPIPQQTSAASTSRTIFSMLGLLFLNILLAIPIGASIWVAWLALGISAIAGIISPFLALLNFLAQQSFSGIVLFTSITFCGFGILLALGAYYSGLALARVTLHYVRWNNQVAKGEHHYG